MRWKARELGCVALAAAGAVAWAAMASAALVEREWRATWISVGAALACAAVATGLVVARRRGALDGAVPRRVLRAALASAVALALALVLPSDRSFPDKRVGAATPTTEYDASTQPGNDVLGKVERTRGGGSEDELTFTVYDVCSGKVAHRAARDGAPAPVAVEVTEPAVLAAQIKDEARALGAQVTGITALHPQFVFRKDNDGRPVELRHRFAIVIGTGLDYRLASPSAPLPWRDYYSAIPEEVAAVLSGRSDDPAVPIPAEVIQEYRDTLEFYAEGGRIAVHLAKAIRSLGYPARAHFGRWSEVQVVPLAIEAGLGEVGKNGMLINDRFGPRGSFAVVTTDIPLAVDRQRDLGVQEFCRVCNKCADACPVNAVPRGDAGAPAGGVSRWQVDGPKCWTYLKLNPKCMACTGACPFNKKDLLAHRWAQALIARKSVVANHLLVWLDDLLGYGRAALRLRDEARRALGEPAAAPPQAPDRPQAGGGASAPEARS
ncbi:4Fe-4S dicluster domain-containing protein [Anaeromyxobacter dehalogenans]|uniref:4Fe-4S ferredoxin, iron-sulfur binding protein n=1 Tax=Anaeromyxobacter dehalogenans (strain 2CP-C) TaxID=290397 RepID=Q2IMS5_ANADE|nr:4Fe-4S dicluster domain-containing protein [Anaeromyxobacter dehalogenans]ABC80107.1 4Fe-4S ferredoxin, iron-sulfur binding protein [Anaeromyxobacter dehalogenans 2CP-C]